MNDVFFVDPLGKEVRVGDTVIYPTTRGQSPVIVKAVVVSIEDVSYTRFNVHTKQDEKRIEFEVGVNQHQDLTKWVNRSTKRTSYPTWSNIVKFGD